MKSYRFVHLTCQMCHFTLENPKKSFSNIITHIIQIIYVSSTVVLQLKLFTYCRLMLPVICIAI